jgi:hypothetical protein
VNLELQDGGGMVQGMNSRNRVNLHRFSASLGLLISLFFTAASHATHPGTKPETPGTFRWIHPNSDPQLWQQIESAFQDELAPDNAKSGQDNLEYGVGTRFRGINPSIHLSGSVESATVANMPPPMETSNHFVIKRMQNSDSGESTSWLQYL